MVQAKKIILLLLIATMLFASVFSQQVITVKNELPFNRNGEMVEVSFQKLKACHRKAPFVLYDEQNHEIAYQLICSNRKPVAFIFQANVGANAESKYILQPGTPKIPKPLVSAGYYPQRSDDFGWENDLAAYRMYGPALAKDKPGDGVDLWLKSTTDLIFANRIRDELKHGISYHINHGDGLDCYGVGQSMGAGGICPYINGRLYIGKHYHHQRIIEAGPLRTVFELRWDSLNIDGRFVRKVLTVTVTAGALLNKGVVRYEGLLVPADMAAGISLHATKGHVLTKPDAGIIAYAEDAVGVLDKIPEGRNFVGVFMPGKKLISKEQDNHLLLIANYKPASEFRYYFGGGWSKWGFETDKDWFNAMEQFALSVKMPFKISVNR
jgi:hypothetical protein